ncbi:hypothetical protein ABVF61_09635 [Roseibium sp. HPY-6]|uniref:hypothetical protein n=1 Tax=Roseibium sp. HPY-6 TaxID=3229852 RepID=UPI00338EACA7
MRTNLIKLESIAGGQVWVNPAFIASIEDYEKYATIRMAAPEHEGSGVAYSVNEKAHTIVAAIEAAEND